MNRINPLHVIALLAVILTFALFKLNNAKTDLADAKKTLSQTSNLSTELLELKKVYADKKRLKKDIEKVLRLPSIRSANIVKKYTNAGVNLESKSIGLVALNALMGKLLNGSYNIKKLKVKKLSDKKSMLEVEIKW